MIAKIPMRNFLLLFFFYPNDFVFCFSHFYPHCNYSSLVILVFHMFVRLYKPLSNTVDLSLSFLEGSSYGPLFLALIFSFLSPLSLTFLVSKHPPRMTT